MGDDLVDDEAKRKLRALLARKSAAREPRRTDPFASSLVKLHAGGAKRPFFCVHPGSGAVGCFSEVAPLVDPARPFYALQAPGVDGTCDPVTDLGALARGYVAEILRVVPEGPYLLGGWSLGGTIAFQMAHDLRAAGEQVGLLALFDTPRLEALHRVDRAGAIEISNHQGAYGAGHLARQRGVEIDVLAAVERFRTERPRTTLARLELMLTILVEHGVFTDATHPMFRVFRANLFALADHGMPDTPYDGDITLFRCRNEELGEAFARVDEQYCWSVATPRPVEVIHMPSHHFALFHGDVLPETARRLRNCIDRAEERSCSHS